ncbi:MAG: AraC family transcriptional regulator [Bacteroidota bacterium]
MKRKLLDRAEGDAVLNYGRTTGNSKGENDISERKVTRSFSFASGTLHEVYFKDFHIAYCDLRIDKKTQIHIESDKETVEMEFVLQGSCQRTSSEFDQPLDFGTNRHNLSYFRPQQVVSHWESPSGVVRMLQINISPTYILKYLLDESETLNSFKKSITAKKSSRMGARSMVITLEMLEIVSQIINCNRKGMVKRLFLESRILDLLGLQLEQFCNENPSGADLSISLENIDKIYIARQFIQDNLNARNITLVELAKQVGTNEFTLKRGFKEVFGVTVFGYWSDLRMMTARNMLIKNLDSIGGIADKLGYKNARHFSTAFKRKYGLSPSQMRTGVGISN